jgi:hypothetical protein
MADIDDPIVREYVNSNDINMAIASDIAYKHAENLATNTTETANTKTNMLIDERLEFHDLVPAHSNESVTTIKNTKNNEYIMAVRGTQKTNISDLASDAQILFNQNVNRVDTVEKVYESFRREQPTAKLTLTGHSLGAYVAHNIANKYNEPFVGFDLPASPFGVISDNVTSYNVKPEHRVYLVNRFDAVSSLNKATNLTDKIVTLPQKEPTTNLFGSHDIKNYIYDKKMPSKLQKTMTNKNTYYSMPHITTSRRMLKSVPVDVNKFYKPEKVRRLRTGYQNECLTNPELKKCKQLNEKKFY